MQCGSRIRIANVAIIFLVAGVGLIAATPVVSLDAAVKGAENLPRIRSLLVSWRGEIILERYFHSARVTSLADIKSASKSVISALVGIAIERGLLPGVDAPIAPYFPELSDAAARNGLL